MKKNKKKLINLNLYKNISYFIIQIFVKTKVNLNLTFYIFLTNLKFSHNYHITHKLQSIFLTHLLRLFGLRGVYLWGFERTDVWELERKMWREWACLDWSMLEWKKFIGVYEWCDGW